MRRRSFLLTLLAAVACRAPDSSPLPEARARETPAVPAAGDAVAVVELFTSEGCSSCPPADAILARLAHRPGVLALSFHVDYWDDLGWPDRFASPDFTARQGSYARALGARGLYTPQLVVGGVDGFVGSDADHADQSVARALSTPVPVHLTLRPRPSSSAEVTVDYQVTGAPAGSLLALAAVERAVTSEVRAGENSGRTLHHANVVRAFATTTLSSPGGSATLRLPPSLHRADADLLGYVQRPAGDGGGMPVLGATSVRLDAHE